jgi:hypothetical protein
MARPPLLLLLCSQNSSYSCSYSEQNVTSICSLAPTATTLQLDVFLLQMQFSTTIFSKKYFIVKSLDSPFYFSLFLLSLFLLLFYILCCIIAAVVCIRADDVIVQ